MLNINDCLDVVMDDMLKSLFLLFLHFLNC